jgi:hypothetical protein
MTRAIIIGSTAWVLATLIAVAAFAQPVGTTTCAPDVIEIRDDGHGRAIVTYSNSVEQCSKSLMMTLTSPNGISVDIRIELLGAAHNYRERITLVPVDDMMMAFPPEGDLLDGETQEFVIQGGIS